MHETGILDHHKMVFSVLRKTFAKGIPKTVLYRSYKKYDPNSFNKALQNKISQSVLSFEEFIEIFQPTLDAFAPYKQKKIGHNKNPFVTKSLRKEIMVRSKLRNKFNKSFISVNRQNYKKQRNKCVKALKHAKTIL